MFKETFIRLCNQKGESPSSVCRNVGITPSAFSLWTDESVPRKATLIKIADYFGVSVDYLLCEEVKEKEPTGSSTVDPRLLSLIDSMTDEELADLERYAEFILSRKNK